MSVNDSAPTDDTHRTPAAVPTLAVVSTTDPIALWHVELSPNFGSNRLSGAWLIDPLADDASEQLVNLLSNCAAVVVDGDTVSDAAQQLIASAREEASAALIDLDKTVKHIGAHIKELRAQVKEEKSKPGKTNLTAPKFPAISNFEPIEFAHTGETVAAAALAAARGVEKLVAQWSEVESQRLRRKYLSEPWGEQARQIPLVEI